MPDDTIYCDNCGKPVTEWRTHAEDPNRESGFCPCHPQGAVITRTKITAAPTESVKKFSQEKTQ